MLRITRDAVTRTVDGAETAHPPKPVGPVPADKIWRLFRARLGGRTELVTKGEPTPAALGTALRERLIDVGTALGAMFLTGPPARRRRGARRAGDERPGHRPVRHPAQRGLLPGARRPPASRAADRPVRGPP